MLKKWKRRLESSRSPQAIPTPSTNPYSSTLLDTAETANQTSWTGLKLFLDVLHKTADGFGPLKSAFGEFSKCVEIFEASILLLQGYVADSIIDQNKAEAREDYRQLRNELDQLFRGLLVCFDGTMPPSMTPVTNSLAQGIEKEALLVLRKEERSRAKCYADAMEDADEIQSTWKIVDEQSTDTRLKNLPHSPAAKYRSAESDSLSRTACTPNTRVDVLQQLQDWAQDPNGHKIYWLNGMAGTGKTTIAYSLCEHLQGTGKLAASFFCSRQLPACRDVNRILPSIAHQLSLFSRPFRYAMSSVLEQDPDVHNQPLPRQFEGLVATPLQRVERTFPRDLVVVVDALDECEDNDGVDRVLYALLAQASNLPVKFFVTSRPDPKILDRMRSELGGRVKSELRLHELDRSAVQEDIKTYLWAELNGHMDLSITDFERLAEQSGVLFIYAATVIRYIRRDNFSRSAKRLRQILDTPAFASNRDRDIDMLYTIILEAALNDDTLESSERDEIKLVLFTVICAQEPLTVHSIASLLNLDSAKVVYAALRPLLSVVQVSDTSGLVTTLHESLPGYLFDEKRSGKLYCKRESHNAYFAQRCFDLIKVPSPPFNICNLKSSYLFDEEIPDLNDKIKKAISQELFYACQYWGVHLELSGVTADLVHELQEFLSARLLLWMEIMNLKQRIYEASGGLYALQAWLQDITCPESLRQLAQDAWKFVTAFSSSPLCYSTPHIYLSALPFWPKHRPVSVQYSSSMRCIAKVTGTAMRRRESAPPAVCYADDSVFCAAYSPYGIYLVSGSVDSTLRIWDAHTGRLVGQPLLGHTGPVYSVAYSPDSAYIASASEDSSIRIWDAQTRRPVGRPLEGHRLGVNSVAYSPSGIHLVSGSRDCTVRIWDAYTGHSLGQPLLGHEGPVNSVAYAPNGAQIISGSSDRTICIWDAHTAEVKQRLLKFHEGGIRSVAYSPNGAHIVSGSDDRTIRIWDARTGDPIGQPFEGHTGPINKVLYSSNGNHIISGSGDWSIRIWEACSGQMVGQTPEGHSGPIYSVAYSPDDAYIASASFDCTIRIWDTHTVKPQLKSHKGPVNSVAYLPDGARIVSGSDDCDIYIWEAHTGEAVLQLKGHVGCVKSVACSPNGACIASGSLDKTIRIWDACTGAAVGQPLEGHTDGVFSVVFSPDSARIVSSSLDGTIRIWDAYTGAAVGQLLGGHIAGISSVAYSPDGEYIVSASDGNDIRAWNAHTGMGRVLHVPRNMLLPFSVCSSVTYSPDGAHIASGFTPQAIIVFDASNRGEVECCGGTEFGSLLTSIAYSPDSAYLVSGGGVHVHVWCARTLVPVSWPLEGHTGLVNSVAYSPDGACIVSGSSDNTIRVWDGHPGAEGRSNSLAMSRQGTWELDEYGWVIGENNQRLIWVLPEVRDALLPRENVVVISEKGWLGLDLSDAVLGEQWVACYDPSHAD